VYVRSLRRETAIVRLSEAELAAERERVTRAHSANRSTAQRVAQRGDQVTSWIAQRARATAERDRTRHEEAHRLLQQGEAVGSALGATVTSVRSAVQSIVAGYAAGKAGTSRAPWLDWFAREFDQAAPPRRPEADATTKRGAAVEDQAEPDKERVEEKADGADGDAGRRTETVRASPVRLDLPVPPSVAKGRSVVLGMDGMTRYPVQKKAQTDRGHHDDDDGADKASATTQPAPPPPR